jgi:hypothetical protein
VKRHESDRRSRPDDETARPRASSSGPPSPCTLCRSCASPSAGTTRTCESCCVVTTDAWRMSAQGASAEDWRASSNAVPGEVDATSLRTRVDDERDTSACGRRAVHMRRMRLSAPCALLHTRIQRLIERSPPGSIRRRGRRLRRRRVSLSTTRLDGGQCEHLLRLPTNELSSIICYIREVPGSTPASSPCRCRASP